MDWWNYTARSIISGTKYIFVLANSNSFTLVRVPWVWRLWQLRHFALWKRNLFKALIPPVKNQINQLLQQWSKPNGWRYLVSHERCCAYSRYKTLKTQLRNYSTPFISCHFVNWTSSFIFMNLYVILWVCEFECMCNYG